MTKKVLITQSNYIPWKGYFDSIAAVDVFVVYDEMQYTKRDWRNRNLIQTSGGPKWLSIPVEVKGKYFQKINETKIADKGWTKSHLGMLKGHYQKAPYFKEMWPMVEAMYQQVASMEMLTDVNIHLIKSIASIVGIDTEIRFSKEFELAEDRTERLANICAEVNGTDYYSGPAAQAYMDESIFEKKGIAVHYWDYDGYDAYEQLNPNFAHGVTILDMLFNLGAQTKEYMKFVS